MLSRSHQREYLHNAWESMLKHYKAFLKGGNPEELHKMRIQIKRIRALFELSLDNRSPRCIRRVQKLFSIGGAIRNAHVTLELAERYQIDCPSLLEQQKQVQKGAMGRLERSKKFRLKSISTACLYAEKCIKEVQWRRVELFYKTSIEYIGSIAASEAISEKHLHDCRKKVKTLMYVSEVLPKQRVKKLGVNIDYLQSVQEAIGEWHDVQMVHQLLEEYGDANVALEFKINADRALRKVLDLLKSFSERAYSQAESALILS